MPSLFWITLKGKHVDLDLVLSRDEVKPTFNMVTFTHQSPQTTCSCFTAIYVYSLNHPSKFYDVIQRWRWKALNLKYQPRKSDFAHIYAKLRKHKLKSCMGMVCHHNEWLAVMKSMCILSGTLCPTSLQGHG